MLRWRGGGERGERGGRGGSEGGREEGSVREGETNGGGGHIHS